jgi:spore coat protein U-like protein
MNKRIIKKSAMMTMGIASACVLAVLAMGSSTSAHAASTSATQQATATVSSSCTISAQNLNFGNLVLPLSAQSASTSMSVLCSKNHAYTIALAYGGVYGQGSANGNSWTVTGSNGSYNIYYYQNGNFVTGITGRTCDQVLSWSQAAVGSTNDVAQTGWTCGSTGSFAVTSAYGYGKMIGVAKGDNVAYSIQVPNQPSQIWNAGESSYSATGTGATQTIPVVGTIVPSQSGSSYPTPDMYMDTVTATVGF